MKEKLFELLTEHCAVAAEDITLDSNLTTDLGMDSVEQVALFMDCEDAFGIEASEEQLKKVQTVGDVLSIVEKG